MNLCANVLIFPLDPELQLLTFDQALRQGATLDDPVVIPPFEYVRAGEALEPRLSRAQ